jgi:hypothetical protein
VGLKAFGGKLNTFYGQAAAITHADTRFVARRTPHITTGAAPTKVHYCDQYNALMYVAVGFGDGTFRHHYLDGATTASPTWVAARRACGEHLRRADGPERLPLRGDGRRWRRLGGAEPVWPTTLGLTVVDGALTWTCRTFAVTDANCPHTKQVAKQAQKIYAVGAANNTTVRYCKTGDPRDWTAASDAGFISAGLYAKGSDQVTAIGPSRSRASRSSSATTRRCGRSIQPGEQRAARQHRGHRHAVPPRAGPVSRDLFFLAQNGFRSVSLISITDNLQDNDVGSAIDALVKAQIVSTDDPLSIYYPKLGQFWCINGSTVWVYTFSRTSKISAWSKYTLPFTIDDATVLNQELYVRTGNDVYRVSDSVYKDGVSSIPLVDVQMFYQDGKRPGVLKQFTGMDIIGTGMWTVSHLFARTTRRSRARPTSCRRSPSRARCTRSSCCRRASRRTSAPEGRGGRAQRGDAALREPRGDRVTRRRDARLLHRPARARLHQGGAQHALQARAPGPARRQRGHLPAGRGQLRPGSRRHAGRRGGAPRGRVARDAARGRALKAVNLVNSGAGDDAVSSAQAGLRNSLNNVSNAQKQELFGDLFSNSADAVTVNNLGAQQAALLGRYRDRLATFFPASGTSSGRVTPTS